MKTWQATLTLVLAITILCLTFLLWPQRNNAVAQTKIPTGSTKISSVSKTIVGSNLEDCVTKLTSGGWCEIVASQQHRSMSSVWPPNISPRIKMITGPKSILSAWNSAALDQETGLMYFTGGGHADYGGNEVYQFDLIKGLWTRLTDPSPLTRLFVMRDYNKSKKKPWRRLCWKPQSPTTPGSTHTYDGLIFSKKTNTLFLLNHGAANGSCLDDKNDAYRDSNLVANKAEGNGSGWYEFNPSPTSTRNGLAPLTWRKPITKDMLSSVGLTSSYPRTAQLSDGRIILGNRFRTITYDLSKPQKIEKKYFSTQADYGDGLMLYDQRRNTVWSLHKNSLLGFNAATGKRTYRINTQIPHGKSLAINKAGKIFTWNGSGHISILDPEKITAGWLVMNWRQHGPRFGKRTVYGKWVYLKKYDVFAGISSHKTGVWIYKHPQDLSSLPTEVSVASYSAVRLKNIINKAKSGDKLTLPPGIYGQGLFINKSLDIDLAGVSLRGVSNSKGIINIKCNDCKVTLNNFKANGVEAGCLSGNCAGIKLEGKNVELRLNDSHINNTVIGILTDNRGGRVFINNTVIENTGLNDRSRTLGHGFYAGAIDQVVFKNSTIRSSYGNGHLFKSRASKTTIENSNIIGLNGRYSRIIDFPCGGELTIINSTLHHGKQTDNSDLISVGTEKKSCRNGIPPSSVTLTNNWIIIDRERTDDERGKERGTTRLFTWYAPVAKIAITNNKIIEPTGNLKFDSKGLITGLKALNDFYPNRAAAGLKPGEIPLRH